MFPRLVWLALGTFAVGTESFVVAPLLPAIGGDLGVPIAAAGWLVTVFALFYAFGAPVLAVALANVERKRLLVGVLGAFVLANLFAALTQSFTQLLLARAMMALLAGLFMASANAVATAMVEPHQRGRAIAIVVGGSAAATALGVPVGSFLGNTADWRMTFVMIAVFAAAGVIGLAFGLKRDLPRSVSTLSERLAVGRRPDILHGLMVTFLFAIGLSVVFTYLAPLLTRAAGFDAGMISATLLVWGLSAAAGNAVGGIATDRMGPEWTARIGLLALAATFGLIGFASTMLGSASAGPVMIAAVGFWGVAGWAVFAAQMTHLARLAPQVAVVTLSLNASTFYAGIAAGSAVASLVVAFGGLTDLGWIASGLQLAALAIFLFGRRRASVAAAEAA
jgi:predicted MFS family arabinose efflux permease